MKIDIFDEIETSEFVPTDRQLSFKLKLHKSVNPDILGKLYYDNLDLIRFHISPFTVAEVKVWIEQHPKFLDWLLAPDEYELKIHKAKMKAAKVLEEILDHPGDDPKTLSVKAKAADMILKMENKPAAPQRVSNTINLKNLPKDLQRKSTEALQTELRQLQEATGV